MNRLDEILADPLQAGHYLAYPARDMPHIIFGGIAVQVKGHKVIIRSASVGAVFSLNLCDMQQIMTANGLNHRSRQHCETFALIYLSHLEANGCATRPLHSDNQEHEHDVDSNDSA
ncbi:hypothetical protein JCM11641_003318 [Rhodosporidiobolus odoratus]